jgi:hypothetical protein
MRADPEVIAFGRTLPKVDKLSFLCAEAFELVLRTSSLARSTFAPATAKKIGAFFGLEFRLAWRGALGQSDETLARNRY